MKREHTIKLLEIRELIEDILCEPLCENDHNKLQDIEDKLDLFINDSIKLTMIK